MVGVEVQVDVLDVAASVDLEVEAVVDVLIVPCLPFRLLLPWS